MLTTLFLCVRAIFNILLKKGKSASCIFLLSPPKISVKGGDKMLETRHYGRKIRNLRENRGLTLIQAAELCNLSDRGLADIELGVSDPKLSTVLSIAQAYGMDLGDLNSCILTTV